MKSINLLPRKPWLQQWFIPLLAVIVFVSLSGGLFAVYVMSQTDSSIAKLQETISKNEKRIQQLSSERQTDGLTQTFNAFSQQITDLKKTRPYWVSIMDMLSSSLPAAARILSINASDQRKLTIALEFGSIPDLADYLISLQKNNLVDTVNVTTLSRTERQMSGKAIAAPQGAAETSGKTSVRAASVTPAHKATAAPKVVSSPQSAGSPEEDLLLQLQQALTQKWQGPGVAQAKPAPVSTSRSSSVDSAVGSNVTTPQSSSAAGSTMITYAATLEVHLKTTTQSK